MNKTSIDWPGLTHTLNPVTGCVKGCSYCYARKLHNRRHEAYERGAKLPEQYKYPFKEMHYWPHILKTVPKKPKKPTKLFIGSMTDIAYWEFGWVFETIEMCKDRPDIEFMFLSKKPLAYYGYKWPKNTMQGLTLTGIETCQYQCESMDAMCRYPRPFLSVEPLHGIIKDNKIHHVFELVIVGMQTKPDFIPKKEWLESIDHHNIHVKFPLSKYLDKLI